MSRARPVKVAKAQSKPKMSASARQAAAADALDSVSWRDPRDIVVEVSDRAGVMRGRIQRPVDRMLRRGQITSRQHEAGRRLQDDWDRIAGLVDRELGMPKGPPVFEPTDGRLDAARRYREALQAVGPRLSPLVVAVILEERSVEAYAQAAGEDRRRLMGKLEHALDEIGDIYRLPGRQGS